MCDEPWALTGMVVRYTDLSSHKGVSLTTRLLPTLLAIIMGLDISTDVLLVLRQSRAVVRRHARTGQRRGCAWLHSFSNF